MVISTVTTVRVLVWLASLTQITRFPPPLLDPASSGLRAFCGRSLDTHDSCDDANSAKELVELLRLLLSARRPPSGVRSFPKRRTVFVD
ncbi:hypothetical protein L596_002593 [Steinernema carpocapsae]|uniref:Secreted protein n=1 Tax=Steinernema carpocapsae TaxID=34508 RepID=A0A4V6I7G5_STECR|nr:hypothetical protein L596_002593 [Steinernema carpocapsae]